MTDGRSVWIGNVPLGITYSKLQNIFSKYGTLAKPSPVTIMPDLKHNCNYAFVDFASSLSVANLLQQNPQIWIEDHLLIIKPSRSKNFSREKLQRSYVDGGEQLNADNVSFDKDICLSSVWIENLKRDVNGHKIYPILTPYGQLSKPGVSIFPRPNGTTCDAFANFVSTAGVRSILDAKSNVFSFGRPLKIAPLDTEEKFGRISEPPCFCINRELNEAYVPFTYFTDAEKVLTNFNGVMKINKMILAVKPMFDIPECTKEALRLIEAFEPKKLTSSDASPHPQPRLNSVVIDNDDNFAHNLSSQMSALSFKPEPNMGIQVRNVNNLTSEKVLLQYFQSDRRSKGGKVVDFSYDKRYDRAVVIFERPEVTENVLNKVNGHVLEGNILYVSSLPPVCNDRIFLENIPNWLMMDKLRLEYYVEAMVRCDVKLTFCEHERNVMVLFKEEKNWEKLKKDFLARPLKDGGRMVMENEMKICSVVYPDAVLVQGSIPSEDSLVLAIEECLRKETSVFNPHVRYVFCKKEFKMSLVVFEDYRAVSCLTDYVTIGEERFSIAPFYDYLGWLKSFVLNSELNHH